MGHQREQGRPQQRLHPRFHPDFQKRKGPRHLHRSSRAQGFREAGRPGARRRLRHRFQGQGLIGGGLIRVRRGKPRSSSTPSASNESAATLFGPYGSNNVAASKEKVSEGY